MNENNNPYAHQKITSKKLYIESNYVKKEDEVDEKGTKVVGIFLAIIFIGLSIGAYLVYIYPTFFKKSYTIEEACNNAYECVDNDDGTRTCSYFDDKDELVKVICNGTTSITTSSKASKTTINE